MPAVYAAQPVLVPMTIRPFFEMHVYKQSTDSGRTAAQQLLASCRILYRFLGSTMGQK